MSHDLGEVIADIARKEAAREIARIGGPRVQPIPVATDSQLRADVDRLSEEVKKLSERVANLESKIK